MNILFGRRAALSAAPDPRGPCPRAIWSATCACSLDPSAEDQRLGPDRGRAERSFKSYESAGLSERNGPPDRARRLSSPRDPARLSYRVGGALHIHPRERRRLLEIDDVAARLQAELTLLKRENRAGGEDHRSVLDELRVLVLAPGGAGRHAAGRARGCARCVAASRNHYHVGRARRGRTPPTRPSVRVRHGSCIRRARA